MFRSTFDSKKINKNDVANRRSFIRINILLQCLIYLYRTDWTALNRTKPLSPHRWLPCHRNLSLSAAAFLYSFFLLPRALHAYSYKYFKIFTRFSRAFFPSIVWRPCSGFSLHWVFCICVFFAVDFYTPYTHVFDAQCILHICSKRNIPLWYASSRSNKRFSDEPIWIPWT